MGICAVRRGGIGVGGEKNGENGQNRVKIVKISHKFPYLQFPG